MRAGHIAREFGSRGPPASLSFVVERHCKTMRIAIIRLVMVYLPLAFVALLEVIALLAIYGGSISGTNDTTIDLSSHVT
jgi:hypothetical protein